MVPTPIISVTRGNGIEGDINADPISPRQILITRKEDLDELNIPYGGLRENIIIDGLPVDSFLPGSVLHLGEKAKIRLTFHCEPCKRIAGVVPSLVEVLKKRGILGVILNSGPISLGDSITCYTNQYEPFSEVPYERFLNFMQYVPFGRVVTYKTITQGMGVAESYIRAMPKYVEKSLFEKRPIPVHRIVDASGTTIPDYVPNQLERLREENIRVVSEQNLFASESITSMVELKKYLWPGSSLYLDK